MNHFNKILILGYGYTAEFLKSALKNQYSQCEVFTTSRNKGGPHLVFNLEDESTWSNLPSVDATFWTFPAAPLSAVLSFYNRENPKLGKLVTLGSTSAFLLKEDDHVYDEHSRLDLEQERVQGEEFLRRKGGVTLFSAGIYGPGRDPRDWVIRGLVGKSQKYVNMVHVNDLCQFMVQALEHGQRGNRYIASDNNPQRWDSVISYWESKTWVSDVPTQESSRPSKKVNNQMSIDRLNVQIIYPDFKKLDF